MIDQLLELFNEWAKGEPDPTLTFTTASPLIIVRVVRQGKSCLVFSANSVEDAIDWFVHEQIYSSVKRVEAFKAQQIVLDPNGRNPVCIPGVGTGVCERCDRVITAATAGDPCPAVPVEERWSVRYDG